MQLGPFFDSPTKPEVVQVGTEMVQAVRELTELPIVAIGGVTAENAGAALAAGATLVAVCQGVISENDPAAAIRKLRSGLKRLKG